MADSKLLCTSDCMSSGYGSYCSGVRDSRTETDDCTVCLRRFYGFLQKQITPCPDLLDNLYAESLINDVSDVTSKSTQFYMIDIIIKSVLKKSKVKKDACSIFLDVLERASWKGIKMTLLKKLDDSRQHEKLTPMQTIRREDILRNKSIIIEDLLSPTVVANFLYERKYLETVEHDEIIYEQSCALQTKKLLEIVERKGDFYIEKFVLALEDTDADLLSKIVKCDKKGSMEDLHVCMDLDEGCNSSIAYQEDMDVDLVVEMDTGTSNNDEICQVIVNQNRGEEGFHELQGCCTEQFHQFVEEIKLGSVIIILTSILKNSSRQIMESCEKDGLSNLVKLLLTNSSVINLLPNEEFKVHLKITLTPSKKTKMLIDDQNKDERIFRALVPFIAEHCHPSWLIEKARTCEGFPRDLERESNLEEDRRQAMISLLMRIYTHSESQLSLVNKEFQEYLGTELSERLKERCPYCNKQIFLNQYNTLLSEIDGRMIALFQDIVSSFEETRKLIFPKGIGRREKVQRLLQFALERLTTVLDLASVLSVHGKEDLVASGACKKLTRECIEGLDEKGKVDEMNGVEGQSLPEKAIQICRSFTCIYKRKDEQHDDATVMSPKKTLDRKPFIVKVKDEGLEYDVEMRSNPHKASGRNRGDKFEATYSETGRIEIEEPSEEISSGGEETISRLILPPESGYWSKSSSRGSFDA